MAELIFRGVKNPANCSECFFWSICPCLADFDDYSAILDAVHDGNLVRHEECPIVPLPKGHGRLGDLDALEKELAFDYAYAAAKVCHNAPTIAPAEGGGEG